MRTVITLKGLDVVYSFKKEQRDSQASLSVEEDSTQRGFLPMIKEPTSPRRMHESRYFRLVSSPPKPRSPPIRRESRAKYRLASTERSRQLIEQHIRRRVKEMHEHSCDYEFASVTIGDPLPSPEKERRRYIRNLREEQMRRYGKSWNWLDSKRFSVPTRHLKSLSVSEREK